MPELTAGEKVLKHWYQGKLGERLLQAAQMGLDRAMLRRGARKMQNGTLGQPGDAPAGEDEMNIRIGDEVHNHYRAKGQLSNPGGSLLAKAAPLLLAILLGVAGLLGVQWLMGYPPMSGGVPAETVVDKDTQYLLELVPGE